MTEGLKELNKIKKLEILYDYEMTENGDEYMKENDIDLSIIEKELEELGEHEEILNDYGLTLSNFREACLLLAQWKGSGLCWADYDRQKKALEIINKKAVNILTFKTHFIISKPEYEEYQYYLDNCEQYCFSVFYLTKQEFELLKEVLL